MLHSQQGVLAKIRRNKTRTAGIAFLLIVTSLGLGLDFLGYSLSHLVLSLFGAGQWALSAAVWQTALVSTAMAFGIGSIAFLAYVVVRKIRNRGPEKPKTVSVKGLEALKQKIKELESDTGGKKQIVSIQYKHPTSKETVSLVGLLAINDKEDLDKVDQNALANKINSDNDIDDNTKFTIAYKNPDTKVIIKLAIISNKYHIIESYRRYYLARRVTVSKIVFKTAKEEIITLKNEIEDCKVKECLERGEINQNTDFIVYLTPHQGKKLAKIYNSESPVHVMPIDEHQVQTLVAEELLKKYNKWGQTHQMSVGESDTRISLKDAAQQRNVCGTGPGYHSGAIKVYGRNT